MNAAHWLAYSIALASATPAWSQIGVPAQPAACRHVTKIDGFSIKMKIKEGPTGHAQFYLAGEVGGKLTGRIALVLESSDGNAERVDFRVSKGTLQYEESDLEFLMQLAARSSLSGAASSFSSRLVVGTDPAAAPACSESNAARPYVIGVAWNGPGTSWTVQDWLSCTLQDREFVCADLRPAAHKARSTRAARSSAEWYVARVNDTATLAALGRGARGSGKLIVSADANSALVRFYFNPKEISVDKSDPLSALPLQLTTPTGEVIRVVLRNARVERSTQASPGSVAMEELIIMYEGIDR